MEKLEYFKKLEKFTDEEFLELYNKGWSDLRISRIFGANQSSVFRRRIKLGICSNFTNTFGKNLTKEEIIESRKRFIKYNCELFLKNYYPKHKKVILEKQQKYYQRPEIKARAKEYFQRSEIKTRRKEYLQNNKERILQQRKEYYQQNKERIS